MPAQQPAGLVTHPLHVEIEPISDDRETRYSFMCVCMRATVTSVAHNHASSAELQAGLGDDDCPLRGRERTPTSMAQLTCKGHTLRCDDGRRSPHWARRLPPLLSRRWCLRAAPPGSGPGARGRELRAIAFNLQITTLSDDGRNHLLKWNVICCLFAAITACACACLLAVRQEVHTKPHVGGADICGSWSSLA